ncbi:uncharacterized protein DMENIID0001_081420 [Sergentomyia squamirostris]
MDSSSEDFDDLCIDPDLDDLDNIPEEEGPKKPHFLDYDAIPPPGLEETTSIGASACFPVVSADAAYPGESVKIDKKYERDGEISDYELAACKSMKLHRKEKSDATVTLDETETVVHTGTRRKKSMTMPTGEREHHSLGREPMTHLGTVTEFDHLKYERKHSLDREQRGRKVKDFMTSSFLEQRETTSSHVFRGTWPADRPSDVHGNLGSSSLPPGGLSDLGPKVECVYSLLSMLGSHDAVEMSSKFLELSRSPETCATLRRSGCIPLLVQMIHSDSDEIARRNASVALHNVVSCHPDDKAGRREAKVLGHIETVMEYCSFLKTVTQSAGEATADDTERHPSQTISVLMKTSFDEEHRHAMCQLGALQAIANLVHLDHAAHGAKSTNARCVLLRRYAGMALTNLTFGDGNNKALLCSNKDFMRALVAQLDSTADDLLQVTASVLRNLSWRADANMISVLNEIGTVTALTRAAMKNKMENTLKAILSALWNLSAHCSANKAEFCAVDGALAFLVDTLTFEAPSKTLTIVENAGGILRNVSSHIAVREDYRQILRQRDCLGILLQQLKSESLTVVSNACGTLWNLSARCQEDQKYLWENQAVPMLRSLINSKHKMISNGSNAALKNLLNFRPGVVNTIPVDSITKSMNLKELPTLNVRKQRALEQELDHNLEETCENLDVTTPPKDEKPIQDFANIEFIHQRIQPSKEGRSTPPIPKRTSLQEKKPVPAARKPEPTPRRNIAPAQAKSGDTAEASESFGDYQETDLDQITDYSLRYAENQSDVEEKNSSSVAGSYGNEIMLTIDDDVKCYQTEGTPYAISNAASMSDLRRNPRDDVPTKSTTVFSSGIQTPEKPVNYCEEGTPGCFSREFSHHGSLSSLEGGSPPTTGTVPQPKSHLNPKTKVEDPRPQAASAEPSEMGSSSAGGATGNTPKAVTFVDSALETPLMFSRTSSIESLSSVEPKCDDDRSSVVSEFSRLASGIISPSEIPDSPTQSVPQSPRRPQEGSSALSPHVSTAPRLRSVFEDDTNTFGIENTPAQFSCATSLSNLSLDDEPKIATDCLTKEMRLINHPSEEQEDEENPQEVERPVENLNNSENLQSDGEESGNDEMLLASCINMGMNRKAPEGETSAKCKITPPQSVGVTEARAGTAADTVKQYFTEDTPAHLSKAASNSDLSVLSLDTNRCEAIASDSSSDGGNENLLQECIRDGMGATSMPLMKENPIEMLRSGSMLPPYLPVRDEIQQFAPPVEDTPCNFSVVSGLSDITVGSGVAGLAKIKRSPSKDQQQTVSQPSGDDSLSSLSVDSEDDTNLLSQAIAAGSNTSRPSTSAAAATSSSVFTIQTALISVPTVNLEATNDSYSSIESSESNDNHAQLLEQCIRTGMGQDVNRNPSSKKTQSVPVSPKKSQLPQLKMSMTRYDRHKEREKKDEQLLKECINIGMGKSPMPKNGETTSAAVPDSVDVPSTAPDVEMVSRDVTRRKSRGKLTVNPINGCDMSDDFMNILERSNEYPAQRLTNMDMLEDSMQESSFDMEISNEFLMENLEISGSLIDKHKDPDLMLKSVDRLTQKLVSQAEYLRSNHQDECSEKKSSSNNTWNEDTCPNDVSFPSISMTAPMIGSFNDDDTTLSEISKGKSVLPEEEATPTNEKKDFLQAPLSNGREEIQSLLINAPLEETLKFEYCTSQPDSIDTDTDTVVNSLENGINFQVGGEVFSGISHDSIQFISSGPLSFDPSSSMTNSTIIAMEAKKIVHQLGQYNPMTDSATSFDLENVRPPSGMDSMSAISGCYETPQSPNLSARARKRSLPPGLIARRALGGHIMTNGSLESINSACNLDSVAPPSAMDELLDSMISVASITSEIAPLQTEATYSNYETAVSEMDDTIGGTRSWQELSSDATPIPSDFSSAESTPRKGKSGLTPKLRRKVRNDRYRTYVITPDGRKQPEDDPVDDELLIVESEEGGSKRLLRKQRREEDRSRFKTHTLDSPTLPQLLSHGNEASGEISSQVLAEANVVLATLKKQQLVNEEFLLDDNLDTTSLVSNDDGDDMSSIRALTARFKHLSDLKPVDPDFSSLDYEQNSGTESCDQNAKSSNESLVKGKARISKSDSKTDRTEEVAVRGRKKVPYVSPYRRSVVSGSKSSSQSASPTKSVSPASRTNLASKGKPQSNPVAAKTSAFINKANLTNKINSIKSGLVRPGFSTKANVLEKNIINKFKSSTAGKSTSPPSEPPRVLDRQSTFTKDEPSSPNVPIVTSEPLSPSKVSKLPAKTKTNSFISKLRTPLQKSATVELRNGTKTTPSSRPSSSGSSEPKKKSFGVYKSPSVPSVPLAQRSNSNNSMKGGKKEVASAVTPPSRSNSNIASAPKNIGSRIAGLWKKNNDDQKKPPKATTSTKSQLKDSPQTISTASSSPTLTNLKLVRSSTFDSSPHQITLERFAQLSAGVRAKGQQMSRIGVIKSPSSNAIKH